MEVEESAVVMSKKMVEMEAQCDHLEKQLIKVKGEEKKMKDKHEKLKGKYYKLKEKLDSEDTKWREEEEEIRERCRKSELENKKLEIDLKAANERRMEAEKLKLEDRNSELVEKIKVLEKEKEDKDAEIRKLKMDKTKRIEIANNAIDVEKKRMGKARETINGLAERVKIIEELKSILNKNLAFKEECLKRVKIIDSLMSDKQEAVVEKAAEVEIEGLKRENRRMVALLVKLRKEKNEEVDKICSVKKGSEELVGKIFELVKRNEVLERENKTMQDQVSKLYREKSEEAKRFLNEKMVAESEKKVMEAKLSQPNMERYAEVKRFLKEKMDLKEEVQKMGVERDEAYQAIKVLYQETVTLEAQNERLQMEKTILNLKREGDVELAHQSHLVSNGAQNQAAAEEEKEDEDEDELPSGGKEYGDKGDIDICRLSRKRKITVTDFRGKTLVSLREYYMKDGKELPTPKGISLTAQQWAVFTKNIPAVEKSIEKMRSRLN